MPLPAMQTPPAIQSPAPPEPDAEGALLEAFDWGRPLPAETNLKGARALEYRWLRAAATYEPLQGLPADPFAAGPRRQEAEALRHLLKAPTDRVGPALKSLPLRQQGTALALWRWGRFQVRSGRFDPVLRRAWEDRLLVNGPALTRGYALRHALCWALAEGDEARLSALRTAADSKAEETLKGIQRLFGLLGGPSPVLRLWGLPGLDYRDLRLDQLGGLRIWICPLEEGPLPDLPKGTGWIIPSISGDLGERDANLLPSLLEEGQKLADRLHPAGRSAFFAPSRSAFENLGLDWFPILIELDQKGDVRTIRMGDAAPEKP